MKKTSFCLLLINLILTACSVTKGPLYAEGEIAGEPVRANMDSEIAKYALAASEEEPALLRQRRLSLMTQFEGVPDPLQLQNLVSQGSTDFASIVYAQALLNQPNNRRWQNESFKLSRTLNSDLSKAHIRKVFEKHHALLIPGWHWKTRTDTGADLSFQRKVLASYGLQSTLIETNEHGSVEDNGKLISDAINNAKALDKSIVLISVSKGGADTLYALGAVLSEQQTQHVKGWLNIGGIIAGSTLIDNEQARPEQWLRSIGFSPETPLDAILSLDTKTAKARLSELKLPRDVVIVNYAALPFASDLSQHAEYSFNSLAKFGPNDGAALIHEMLVPDKTTVLEIGLDHFMRSLRAMYRALALLTLIMECEEKDLCV
tara:strand:- start:227508 stop:228632 length:1125 start_codon:yes stop_codon:yes gene_type:complete